MQQTEKANSILKTKKIGGIWVNYYLEGPILDKHPLNYKFYPSVFFVFLAKYFNRKVNCHLFIAQN